MTRTLYAQLTGQKFYPPKPFEKAQWMKEETQDSVEGRRREIGMKLVSCSIKTSVFDADVSPDVRLRDALPRNQIQPD